MVSSSEKLFSMSLLILYIAVISSGRLRTVIFIPLTRANRTGYPISGLLSRMMRYPTKLSPALSAWPLVWYVIRPHFQ